MSKTGTVLRRFAYKALKKMAETESVCAGGTSALPRGAARTAPTIPSTSLPPKQNATSWAAEAAARPVQIIAHRGGANDAPENTLGALEQALVMGADGVEFDLQRTADGRLIILHDDTLERTAPPFSEAVAAATGLDESNYARIIRTNVNLLTLAEVQLVDIGSFFGLDWQSERVGVFEDALELIAKFPGRKLYAEIKRGDFQSADLAAEIVAKFQPDPEQLWFIGFNFDVMKYTKNLLPTFPMLHVLEPRVPILGIDMDEFIEMASESARVLDGVDPCALSSSIGPRVVDAIHSLAPSTTGRAKTVACWVWKRFPETDMEENWQQLIDSGVDAITTDRPADLLAFLARGGGTGVPDGGVDVRVVTPTSTAVGASAPRASACPPSPKASPAPGGVDLSIVSPSVTSVSTMLPPPLDELDLNGLSGMCPLPWTAKATVCALEAKSYFIPGALPPRPVLQVQS
eukprot:INCI2306.1.p1 GENE.INCI2306.1~~INCI2306.1.p1  ORF type:complete len:461 (-),score=87.52 INCI2306.1:339-1721(-)